MIFNGFDYSTYSSQTAGASGLIAQGSMDTSFTPIFGARVCIETLVRKLTSPPGSFDDLSWGMDLRQYLGASLLPQEIEAVQNSIREQCLAEEYVDDASAQVYVTAPGEMVVRVSVVLSDEKSYQFAFALGPAGIALIVSVGAA